MKTSIACVFLAVFLSLQCLSLVSCGNKVRHNKEKELEENKIIKVKVALYMESLCPGCHSFIKTQLFPVFMKYYRFIQLDMVPYGNARQYKNKDGQWEFTCQHGQPECLGNLYLACATHILQQERPKHLMRYYNCLADADGSTIQKDVEKHHKNKDGQWEFTCQHGPPECLGNMYLACATYLLEKDRPRHLMRYYNCLADAASFSIEKDVKEDEPTLK